MTFDLHVRDLNKDELRKLTFFVTALSNGTAEDADCEVEEEKASKKKTSKKVAKKVSKKGKVEEDEEEEDEVDFDADEEEEDEDGEEEEEEKPAKKKVGKKGTSSTGKSESGTKLTLKDVIAAFGSTHTKLAKKLKSDDKAQAKLNAVLKKHGAVSTRKLDAAKYATVIKELKALVA